MKPERCNLTWIANEDGDTLQCSLHAGHEGDHIGDPAHLIPAPFVQCPVRWITATGCREQCLLDHRHPGPHRADSDEPIQCGEPDPANHLLACERTPGHDGHHAATLHYGGTGIVKAWTDDT